MKKQVNQHQLKVLKATIFSACLIPFVLILWDGFNNSLGAEPIQILHFRTGDWALRFLLITLAMSPLQRLLKTPLPIRLRRMLGLFAFFYASFHLMVWLALDQSLSLDNILEDVPESPYIMLGLFAYVMLIPLAATSTAGMMRRLGKSWVRLHRTIYFIAAMGVVHFFWLTKLDYTEPLIYTALLVILLMFRWQILKRAFICKNK